MQKYLRQHQPNERASGVELFEKRLEAAEGSPTVSVVSEKNEAAQYAAVKGVSIDSDVDSDTVEINAVAGAGAQFERQQRRGKPLCAGQCTGSAGWAAAAGQNSTT